MHVIPFLNISKKKPSYIIESNQNPLVRVLYGSLHDSSVVSHTN
jgi:hypothetical protein